MTETLNDAATDPQQTIAELQRKLAERTAERDELLQQRTATADVLKVISRSAFDLESALVNVCETAARLCDADQAAIYRRERDLYHFAASFGFPQEYADAWRAAGPAPNDPKSPLVGHRAVAERRPVQVLDVTADPAFLGSTSRASQSRTALGIPLMREGKPVGNFVLARQRVEAFTDRQLELVQTFADQAVIAIENARLFNETKEALERQTATSDVLQAISESMADSAPVFERILDRCEKLLQFTSAAIILIDGNEQRLQTARGPGTRILESLFPQPLDSTIEEAFRNRQPLYTANFAESAMTTDALRLAAQKVGGYSLLQVPMFWQGRGIGAIYVSRLPNVGFSDKEVALLTTFADQAVIAIQNARLFNETKEALEQQKASADILSVISHSVAETQPVFDEILRSIARLFGSQENYIFVVGEGNLLHVGAGSGPRVEQARALFPAPLDGTVSQVAIRERRLVSSANVFDDPEIPSATRERYRRLGENYSMVVAPMLREDSAIGSIMVARTSMVPFSEKECNLLRTFADQAVIAIQNARLFNETKRALERQTATADVLRIISRSVAHAAPVFDTILESCQRLFNPYDAAVYLVEGDRVRGVARRGPGVGDWGADSMPLEGSSTGVAIAQRQPVHFPDLADKADLPEDKRAVLKETGGMTALYAPMISQDSGVGSLVVTRRPKKAFTEIEIDFIQSFANQAVIAIENARLFDEVEAKTSDLSESLQQQTATADVLKVISRSAFDLQTVLETLTRSAVELCGANRGIVMLRHDDLFHFRAHSHPHENPDWIHFLRQHPQKAGRNSASARSIQSGETVCVPDVLADPEIDMPATALAGIRAVLAVPLLRDGKVEGLMVLSRPTPGPFNARQIGLVQTFADQAVIAIENVRLFDEVQARTKDLAASLDDLRTAQDRLVQTEKLASLGQLTAGIAHEIKNPLNFVNNFSALSVELIDELDETLAPAPLDQKIRGDVGELTQMLKSNLEKVVQHGKRADSIVKNMLLHSREGSGEHRSADINALVEESLNLAYHGARAEKPGFNVIVKHDLDPDAGAVELYPQEITRALLNLISNGFYAATQRKSVEGETFEPVLIAATKNLGKTVEIRIRDNGTGVPDEVKEKIFNPFFTTKPSGEGTGLGLSMSHDIIVKQHGGSIDVETEPGLFTEFKIVLPRTNQR